MTGFALGDEVVVTEDITVRFGGVGRELRAGTRGRVGGEHHRRDGKATDRLFVLVEGGTYSVHRDKLARWAPPETATAVRGSGRRPEPGVYYSPVEVALFVQEHQTSGDPVGERAIRLALEDWRADKEGKGFDVGIVVE